MLFGKKQIVIKRRGYGAASRGGVQWLKWFFDHGGFWTYLLLAVIVVFASDNRVAPHDNNNDAASEQVLSQTDTATNKNDGIALIPGLISLSQVLTSNIGQSSTDFVIYLGNLVYANEQNKKLRQELTDYNLLKQQIIALQHENLELSKLLKFQPSKTGGDYVTARIIGDAGTSGRQTWLINRGSRDGITKGSFAVGDVGLIGVVVEVSNNSARILRLSDPNFYLPVTVADRKFRAVLRGNSSPIATLDYFDGLERPAIGDVVVSTGSGGNFPPFLPIGTIYDKKLGEIGVLIFAEKNPPIYVKIYKP